MSEDCHEPAESIIDRVRKHLETNPNSERANIALQAMIQGSYSPAIQFLDNEMEAAEKLALHWGNRDFAGPINWGMERAYLNQADHLNELFCELLKFSRRHDITGT